MSASLKYLHPKARKAWSKTVKDSGLSPVVVQTLGGAPASKGTHDAAGKYKTLLGAWVPYSVCIDVSVNQTALHLKTKKLIKMGEAQIKWFLFHAAMNGIPGWLRTTAQGFDPHIHLVCAMLPLSGIPESQVIDFLFDRRGLKHDGPETFWTASDDVDQHIATLFALANPEAAKRLPAKYRGVLT